jgi:hypothetical protein
LTVTAAWTYAQSDGPATLPDRRSGVRRASDVTAGRRRRLAARLGGGHRPNRSARLPSSGRADASAGVAAQLRRRCPQHRLAAAAHAHLRCQRRRSAVRKVPPSGSCAAPPAPCAAQVDTGSTVLVRLSAGASPCPAP